MLDGTCGRRGGGRIAASLPGFAVNVLVLMKLLWSAGQALSESICLFRHCRTVVGWRWWAIRAISTLKWLQGQGFMEKTKWEEHDSRGQVEEYCNRCLFKVLSDASCFVLVSYILFLEKHQLRHPIIDCCLCLRYSSHNFGSFPSSKSLKLLFRDCAKTFWWLMFLFLLYNTI